MTSQEIFMATWNNRLSKIYTNYQCEFTDSGKCLITRLTDKDSKWMSVPMLKDVISIANGLNIDADPWPIGDEYPKPSILIF